MRFKLLFACDTRPPVHTFIDRAYHTTFTFEAHDIIAIDLGTPSFSFIHFMCYPHVKVFCLRVVDVIQLFINFDVRQEPIKWFPR